MRVSLLLLRDLVWLAVLLLSILLAVLALALSQKPGQP